MPAWVTSDQLTLFGVFGGGLVAIGYGLSRFSPAFFWLSVLGYVANWFGDSMDGSLARSRGAERPRYGRFIDHSADAFSNLLILGGFGLTIYVRMDVALFAVVGYLVLAIYVVLRAQTLDELQLSFLAGGPTEMRICLAAATLLMLYAGPVRIALGPVRLSGYDGFIGAIGVTCLLLFGWNTVATANLLRRRGETVGGTTVG